MGRPARHSLSTQLSGAALGRVLSVDQAAAILGVDRNSVRRWMRDHPAEDDWHIIEQMAGAQLVERVAKGQVKSARDLAVLKGVAGRNRRAQELIARRDARRAQADAEADAAARPNPVHEASLALPRDRRKWLVSYLDMAIEYHRIIEANGGPKVADIPGQPAEYDEAEFVRQIEGIGAASDAELQAMRDALAVDAIPHLAGWRAFRDRPDGDLLILDRNGQRFVWMRHPELYASLPVIVQHGDGLNVTPQERRLIAEAEQLLLETAS